MNNIYLVPLTAIISHTQSAVFLGGKMLLSSRHQLHHRLNLKPLVYSLLALLINGWKYFYLAFCSHKDFGTVRTLPTSVLKKDSSKIHDGREMLAAESPSQKIPTPCHHETNHALLFLKRCLFLFRFRKEI